MPESLAPPYRVSIATGAEGLRSLREAWLALERRVGTTRVAQTWRWHEAAATHLFDADAPPLYVQVRAGDITVALAALQAAGRLRFGPLSFGRLSSPAHPHLGLTDWLILPGTQAVPLVEGIIDALRSASLPRWTLLDVDRLPVNAAAFEVLRNVPGAIVQPHGQSAWFDCSRGTPDTAIPKRMRRNLRRLRARAREAGPVRASFHVGAQVLDGAFDRFVELESSGWKGSAGTGSAIALCKRLSGFYRALATPERDAAQCRINLLHVGDEVVAAQFVLASSGEANLLKIGFSEAHAALAPGLLLLEDFLDACTDDPAIDRVNLVTAPDWAMRWHPMLMPCHNVRLFVPNPVGSAARAMQRVHDWMASRRAPAPVAPAPLDGDGGPAFAVPTKR